MSYSPGVRGPRSMILKSSCEYRAGSYRVGVGIGLLGCGSSLPEVESKQIVMKMIIKLKKDPSNDVL